MCEGTDDKPSWVYGFANTFEVMNIGKNFKPSRKTKYRFKC